MEIILRPDEIPPDLLEFFEPVPEDQLTDAWLLSPEPYAAAHFATFPSSIPKRAILAGCPAMCCPDCGAGWRRVVERERTYDHVTTANGKSKDGPYASQTGNGTGTHDIRHGVYSKSTTTGWQPTCRHEHTEADTVPGVVLDPFSGSGTSGMVALRLGRRYIGLELNQEYVRMSVDRITGDAPLFNTLELGA